MVPSNRPVHMLANAMQRRVLASCGTDVMHDARMLISTKKKGQGVGPLYERRKGTCEREKKGTTRDGKEGRTFPHDRSA